MEKYNRNHILTVIDDFISSLIKSIIPLFFLFAGKLREKESSSWSDIIAGAAFMAIILFLAVASFLKWYKNVYYIDNYFIILRSGIFVIQRREIPFNKIQTINISQSIIQRLFNLAEIKIDTGNSSVNKSEVSIKIKKADAEKIREAILGSKSKDEDLGIPKENITGETDNETKSAAKRITENIVKQYVVTNKELLVSGLTSNAVLAGFAFLASIYGLLNDYLSSVLENSVESLGRYIGGLDFKDMALSRIIMLISIIFLIFFIFSFALSIIGTYIKYYGFTVKREDKNIVIGYGLFEKRNYIIPTAKIKAVYIKQSLLRQLMGLYAINVESIGYGNEQGEEAILYPIAGESRKRNIIAELLPEYLFEEEMTRVPKTALRRFIVSSALIPLLLCIVLTVIFSYGWLSFILMPVFILKGYLEYRNSAIALNNKLLCLSNCAFTKSTSLVATRDVQSVTDRSNFMQRRRGLFNYIISIQSNAFGKTIEVKNLSAALKEMLLGII